MSEIEEALEDAEQLLVPGPSLDLHVAGTALRTERPEPCQLVAALPSRVHAEAAKRAYEVKSVVLTGLSSATIPICLGGKRHLHGSGQGGRGAVNWCARVMFLSY
jgi:hypothetical protein